MKLKLICITLLVVTACKPNKNDNFDINTASLDKLQKEKLTQLKVYDSINNILSKLDVEISKKDTLKRLPVVTAYIVKDTLFKHFVELQGNVATDKNVLIYPEYQGMLTKVYVKEGQQVRKGELLAIIDDGGLGNQLAQLKTQYQLAQTTFERQSRLWKQQIGSEMQYLQAKSAMESTGSAVKQIKSQLARTKIKAPFSGVIDELVTKQGQIVTPGAVPLMRIINLNAMYVKANVPETYLNTVVKGVPVNVTFPSIKKQVTGVVKTVSNYINPSNRTFDIQINVPNQEKKIKPNLIAKLEINDYNKNNAILIPSNVIQENAIGDKFVYVIDKSKATAIAVKRKIEIGFKNQGYFEVVKGLSAGDVIVNEGALTLKDGTEIKIENK